MRFYEFFAGGGMARLGLGPQWRCLFANDIDETKAESYIAYFGNDGEFFVGDIATVTPGQLPERADLAWASFPCQDLSLAGNGAGLTGNRSGTFWPFWRLMQSLVRDGRAPRTIILENVYGTITSNKGQDLATICESLAAEGYCFAPLVIDAQMFLPQSRPRLFIAAFGPDSLPPERLISPCPTEAWHPKSFNLTYNLLSETVRGQWLWISPPQPPVRNIQLDALIDNEPEGIEWHHPSETARLLGMMSPANLAKVEQAKRAGARAIGAVYKRTRKDENGVKRQRAEVRFDGLAGCLRTPAGGSSRQIILVVEGEMVRSRLLSAKEAARLMGLPEDYPLPLRYNDAYHLAGDGVAVPVVDWLARNLIEPTLRIIEAVA